MAPVAPVAPVATVARRPSGAALVAREVAWTVKGALRDPGWMFFAVLMPVGLYSLTETMMTGGEVEQAGGASYHVALVAGMVGWGALVNAFVNTPEAAAVARDRGLLKRLRGTPLSPVAYVAGKAGAAVLVSVVAAALVVGAAAVLFDVSFAWAGLPAALALLTLGTAALVACGFLLAALVRNGKAVTAVSLSIALPLSFFSDVFAVSQTPDWMGTVGSVFPLRHLTNAVAAALDPGLAGPGWVPVVVMTGWLLGAGVLAVRLFHWSPRG